MGLYVEFEKLSSLTSANWNVDKHIIASLKTKNTRMTGLKKLFISVENLKHKQSIAYT
jgi:hypothetical protein